MSSGDQLINVALLQMMPSPDNITANIEIATNFCSKAASLGADIALFPEMWNVGSNFLLLPNVFEILIRFWSIEKKTNKQRL